MPFGRVLISGVQKLPLALGLSATLIAAIVQAADEADWGKASDNRIYAQKLVNRLMVQYPELLVVGLHAVAPGAKDETMIATNLDRVGKLDDEDDIAVATERKTILAPNLKESNKFEVQVPLKDEAGRIIGATGLVFQYRAGDDQLELHRKALAIRGQLQQQIPDLASLFEPADPSVQAIPTLQPATLVTIPGASGKFDFLEVDTARHRLLAAHENSGTADFIDLDSNRLVARSELGTVVDVIAVAGSDEYFVSVQEGKRVAVINADTFKETGSLSVNGPTDAIFYVEKYQSLYVTHDNGTHVWVFDAASKKQVATIDIPGAPECIAYDPRADRLYLNIKTTNEVVSIDPAINVMVARWSVEPAKSPHGIAVDPATRRIFSAGANGKLAVLDANNGKLIGSVEITRDVDQIEFDPATRRIYAAGPNWMSVVQETPNGAVLLDNVPSSATAKNVAVDPATHRVWTTYTDGKDSFARSWALP